MNDQNWDDLLKRCALLGVGILFLLAPFFWWGVTVILG